MKNLLRAKFYLKIVASVGFSLLVIVGLDPSSSGGFKERGNNKSLEDYAQVVIDKCAKVSYRPGCYDEEIPKLMDFLSMEEAFEVTSIIQQKDKSYGYCHILGHRLASREVQKNPSKYIEVIHRGPMNGMCANGALHGAVQERFRSEVLSEGQLKQLEPELKNACEAQAGWQPAQLAKAICYHGLGHLTVIVTSADFAKALKVCDVISLKENGDDYRSVCYEGAFMQLFQPLEPEDFALVKGKGPEKEGRRFFCLKFSAEDKQEACWREGWPLFRSEVATPAGLVEFCEVPDKKEQQDSCFQMLLHTVGQNFNFDSVKIAQFCNGIIDERKGDCFYNAASSVLEADQRLTDESLEVCSLANSQEAKDECYEGLAQGASYIFQQGSDSHKDFCQKLPKTWAEVCLKDG